MYNCHIWENKWIIYTFGCIVSLQLQAKLRGKIIRHITLSLSLSLSLPVVFATFFQQLISMSLKNPSLFSHFSPRLLFFHFLIYSPSFFPPRHCQCVLLLSNTPPRPQRDSSTFTPHTRNIIPPHTQEHGVIEENYTWAYCIILVLINYWWKDIN